MLFCQMLMQFSIEVKMMTCDVGRRALQQQVASRNLQLAQCSDRRARFHFVGTNTINRLVPFISSLQLLVELLRWDITLATRATVSCIFQICGRQVHPHPGEPGGRASLSRGHRAVKSISAWRAGGEHEICQASASPKSADSPKEQHPSGEAVWGRGPSPSDPS